MNKIEELKTKMNDFLSDINIEVKKIDSFYREIDSLESKKVLLCKEHECIQKKVDDLRSSCDSIRLEITSNNSELSKLININKSLSEELDGKKIKLDKKEEELNKFLEKINIDVHNYKLRSADLVSKQKSLDSKLEEIENIKKSNESVLLEIKDSRLELDNKAIALDKKIEESKKQYFSTQEIINNLLKEKSDNLELLKSIENRNLYIASQVADINSKRKILDLEKSSIEKDRLSILDKEKEINYIINDGKNGKFITERNKLNEDKLAFDNIVLSRNKAMQIEKSEIIKDKEETERLKKDLLISKDKLDNNVKEYDEKIKIFNEQLSKLNRDKLDLSNKIDNLNIKEKDIKTRELRVTKIINDKGLTNSLRIIENKTK